MNMLHVTPFLNSMHARNATALGEHMAENVILYAPFATEPFVGKDVVLQIISAVLSAVDEFSVTAIIPAENRAAIMVRIRLSDIEVTGVDDMTIDKNGYIASMTVQWRPLAQVVALQQKLAPLLGAPAFDLVEINA